MAISSYNAKLMAGSAQLCPIKGIPQIGGEPEQIETTTLDDKVTTFIDGIQSQEAMSFTSNYDKTIYAKIKGLEGTEQDLSIWLGNDGAGSDGKYSGKGKVSVYINEADVNSVIEMTITVTPTTAFTLGE